MFGCDRVNGIVCLFVCLFVSSLCYITPPLPLPLTPHCTPPLTLPLSLIPDGSMGRYQEIKLKTYYGINLTLVFYLGRVRAQEWITHYQ